MSVTGVRTCALPTRTQAPHTEKGYRSSRINDRAMNFEQYFEAINKSLEVKVKIPGD